jgi:arylsulfatase A-like enzyme
MSMNGYRRPTTPRIDRFKERAIWFRNAYSTAPSTRFALSQIFTGLEVPRIPQKRGSGVDYWLLPEATTLAERLAPAGYDTVGYTLSYVLQHIHDVGQGYRQWTTPWRVDEWKETYHDAAELTTTAALEYLKATPQDGSKPYFLFLHYGATHDPYIKHAENPAWDYGDEPIDLYDSALDYEDAQLGRLFDALDARADTDRTVVLLYSDHGELFGEHGFTKHGNTLYQPDVRVMLLAKMPGAAPRAIDAPTALSDLSATILHLTGLPPDPKSQAWDLVPYMQGAPMPSRTLFFYGDLWRSGVHFENRAVLLPDGKTKFIRDVSNDQNMLFDLQRDPGELTSVAGSQPALASKMSEEQDSWEAFESAGMSWEDSHAAKGGEREGEDKDRNPGD